MANILLIEPDKALAATYRRALMHDGHVVACVQQGQAAIEAADARTPDVVVLELQLAIHDGVTFLHEFRSYAEWRDIPIIVNTYLVPSTVEPLRQSMARDLGVSLCLYKPATTIQQLLSAVKTAIFDRAGDNSISQQGSAIAGETLSALDAA